MDYYFIAPFTDCTYYIHPNGEIKTNFNKEHDSVLFSINIEKGFYIENAELIKINNRLVIIYTESNHESSGSTMLSINLNNYLQDWKVPGLGFNLSRIRLRDNYGYITSIGTVSKIDLNNGRIEFNFSNLYDPSKQSFNSFDTILFKGDTVIFSSRNWRTGSLDQIVVNDRTNLLLKIVK